MTSRGLAPAVAALVVAFATLWGAGGSVARAAASQGTSTSTPVDTAQTCKIDGLFVQTADYQSACPESPQHWPATMSVYPAPGLLNYPEQFSVVIKNLPAVAETTLPQYMLYPGTGVKVQLYPGASTNAAYKITWTVGSIIVDYETDGSTTAVQVTDNNTCTGTFPDTGTNGVGRCERFTASSQWASWTHQYGSQDHAFTPRMLVNWQATLPFTATYPLRTNVQYQTVDTTTPFDYTVGSSAVWNSDSVVDTAIKWNEPYTKTTTPSHTIAGGGSVANTYHDHTSKAIYSVCDQCGAIDIGGDEGEKGYCTFPPWEDEAGSDPGGSIDIGHDWPASSDQHWGCYYSVTPNYPYGLDIDDQSGASHSLHDRLDSSTQIKFNDAKHDQSTYPVVTEIYNDQSKQIGTPSYNQSVSTKAPVTQWTLTAKQQAQQSLVQHTEVNVIHKFDGSGCPVPQDLGDPKNYNTAGNPSSGLIAKCLPNFATGSVLVYDTCAQCGNYTSTSAKSNSVWSYASTLTDKDNQTLVLCPGCGTYTHKTTVSAANFTTGYTYPKTTTAYGANATCAVSFNPDNDGDTDSGAKGTYAGQCATHPEPIGTAVNHASTALTSKDTKYDTHTVKSHPYKAAIATGTAVQYDDAPVEAAAHYDTPANSPSEPPRASASLVGVSSLVLTIAQLQPVQGAVVGPSTGAPGALLVVEDRRSRA